MRNHVISPRTIFQFWSQATMGHFYCLLQLSFDFTSSMLTPNILFTSQDWKNFHMQLSANCELAVFWWSYLFLEVCNSFSVGNLMSAAAVLFCMNTYHTTGSFFQLANIQWISKTSYYEIQKKKLVSIENRNHVQHSEENLMTMKRRGNCCLSGDNRCGSPVNNAKYLRCSLKLQLCL